MLVLCGQLGVAAFSSASANTDYYRAQNSLIAMPSRLPSKEQVDRAHQYISSALTHTQPDANVLDMAGRIDYFRAIYEPDPLKKKALLSSSKQHHLNALEIRPFWPYSEVNILYVSSAAGALNDEFLSRFARAKMLAPDDRDVTADLAKIGIKTWNHLSEQAQNDTVELTEVVLKQRLIHENQLKAYMYNNGQFHRICSRLRQFEEKQRFCNS